MVKKILLTSLLILLTTNIYCDDIKSTVKITGYYKQPKSFYSSDTIILQSSDTGEYVEIIVDGTIIDFEVISFDDRSQKMKLNKVQNNTIILITNQPEGIPQEIIKWKDLSGKYFEYLIQDYNTGIVKSQSHIYKIN